MINMILKFSAYDKRKAFVDDVARRHNPRIIESNEECSLSITYEDDNAKLDILTLYIGHEFGEWVRNWYWNGPIAK